MDREIAELIEKDGDKCTLCRAPFRHGCDTYGGLISKGACVIVSDCCAKKLRHVYTRGVYLVHNYYDLPPRARGSDEPLLPEQIEKEVAALKNYVASVDDLISAHIAKRAGIPAAAAKMASTAGPWKVDDINWFKANPERSHRIRAAFPDERPERAPPGFRLEALVRQVEPRSRVRTFFYRREDSLVPDDESVIHALFDLVAERWRDESVAPVLTRDILKEIATSLRP